jgi:hypothetical protein
MDTLNVSIDSHITPSTSTKHIFIENFWETLAKREFDCKVTLPRMKDCQHELIQLKILPSELYRQLLAGTLRAIKLDSDKGRASSKYLYEELLAVIDLESLGIDL